MKHVAPIIITMGVAKALGECLCVFKYEFCYQTLAVLKERKYMSII